MANVSISVTDTDKPAREKIIYDSTGKVEVEGLFKKLKSDLIEISLLALREEQSRGFPLDPAIQVDKSFNKRIEDVNPMGQIRFIAKVDFQDFLIPIYEGLLKRSPVDSGTYKEQHFVYVNGKLVAKTLEQLKIYALSKKETGFTDGDLIRFVDVTPYASKLERNAVTATNRYQGNVKLKKSTDKKRNFRSGKYVRAPNGVYFLTAKSILKNFKNNSKIEFQWVNGANLDLSQAATRGKRGNKFRRTFAKKRKGSYTYPSIVVVINTKAIK